MQPAPSRSSASAAATGPPAIPARRPLRALTGPGGIGTIGATVNRLANRLVPGQTAAVSDPAQAAAVWDPARRPPAVPR
jgi:hypothetical protein